MEDADQTVRRVPGVLSTTGASTAAKMAVAVVAPLVCALAVLGGIGSFTAVHHLAAPWFGGFAWIVPVGIDIGILALLAWDLLDEYLGLPWAPLRWTAWGFIAATVYLNIAAAHGTVTAAVMHASMPVLFITVIEGIRHLIRQVTGLTAGTRTEPVPAARWILAPRSSFLLFRHMALWHITSYRRGLALEQQRLQAIACLQQRYGHYLWRWRAPLSDRLALRAGPAELGVASPLPTEPPRDAERPGFALTSQVCRTTTEPLSQQDKQLVEMAADILHQAERQGHRLSQSALARQMRARGQPIANQRLRWLTTTARTWPPIA